MTVKLGIALELACAVITQPGFLCEHRDAKAVPTVDTCVPPATSLGVRRPITGRPGE